MWGQLFAVAAVTTASVVSANNTPNNSGGSYPSGVSSSKTGNMDYLLDPNNAVQQVNAQNEAEYQQAKRFNPSLTKEQFMQMKVQAWQAARQTETGGGTSYNVTVGNTSTHQNANFSCPLCHGTGRIVHDSYQSTLGTSDYKVYCSECGQSFLKSTGHSHINCTQCHGRK